MRTLGLVFLVLLVVVIGLDAAPGQAVKLAEPVVEYAADYSMETEDATVQGKRYHSGSKDRMEMADSIVVTRHDKQVIWILMPQEHSYMEQGLKKDAQRDPNQFDIIEETVVGEEVINGMKTTKYKQVATDQKGSRYGGFMWRTKDGIVVKTDHIIKDQDGKQRLKMELKNIKIGKQDPRLFEIPSGYTKFAFGDMQGKGMPNLSEMMKEAEKDEPAEEKPGEGQISEMLKKLMGK